ncbi:hypothetical protein [Paenibacillus xylanexedens]|uniref:hypothetical protein n=1 Tax=Paenibacillus xylanexedens TaxID=528191 RepID=UPI000F54202F|nr:hypothetical protein [Paenibacillus xylanexedens]RPK29392.1 hypothetical protein EDO6_00015 [Paenibacillus xylanexedens]
MESNQQFNEEEIREFSKTIGTLGVCLVLLASKLNPVDIGLDKKDVIALLKAVDQSESSYQIFNALKDEWDHVELSEEEIVQIYKLKDIFSISTDQIVESIKHSNGGLGHIDGKDTELH